jgi:tetratricopeptide (TPR) repeat protein
MARVYLARDVLLNRDVAVKKLNPELSAALGQERFLREIEILTHLNHPHILPLLDKGEADGLLCYVMPYIAGESLRHRLRRETQLRIEDAIAIARDVAGALDYAHRQGIVHRDIKPENILMSEGLAIVADFGIARAITLAAGDDDRITQSGVSPGTPPYMSPEQASGQEVDGRSDVYALGCVLYEMLAGQPPFMGPTTQAILARHLADPVPPLRTVRKTVPEPLEQAVLKALEKVPADRFATAAEFTEALAADSLQVPRRRGWRRLTVLMPLAGAAAIVGLALLQGLLVPDPALVAADSTRYAILPFERDAGIAALNEDQSLQDALTRWSGVEVVDPFQVRDAVARASNGTLSTQSAQRVAAILGSGRYVRGRVTRSGDSLRIYAAVYDATRGGAMVHDGAVKVGVALNSLDSAFAKLGDELLFGNEGPAVRPGFHTGTSSRPARQAFASGLVAIEQWNLTGADSDFAAAASFDPEYAQALLWLAQVRVWNGAPVAIWQSAAERAGARLHSLSQRDQALANALLALSRQDLVGACRLWTHLTKQSDHDFSAWYGLGNCLASDEAVVADSSSPSHWSFRSSYAQALRAYQRAFLLLPSIHKALRGQSYRWVRNLLMTSYSDVRQGRAVAPDTTEFAAYAAMVGDSLALIPFPSEMFRRADPRVVPGSRAAAVRHQRNLFREIATEWSTAFPASPDAMEAVAVSLDLLGDPSALDTLRRAMSLAASPEQRLRILASEVGLLIRLSAPSDTAGLRRARQIADSLLTAYPPRIGVPEPLLLASLAALTGRAYAGAAFSRQIVRGGDWIAPAALAEPGPALLMYAAMGGPPDSLIALERTVESAITHGFDPATQLDLRFEWLGRSATLAFPEYPMNSIASLAGKGDYLVDAEAAYLNHDSTAVRRALERVQIARQRTSAPDRALDALLPEASLFAAIGDYESAARWLGPTLDSLPRTSPQVLMDPVRAGSLLRAMALRAELADQIGDRVTAREWARAVSELWSGADQFLSPVLDRMRRLTQ